MVAFERIAQKVAAGDSFTTAQQNAAAQLLEIAAAVRELAAETDAADDPGGVWGTQVTRAQQLVTRTAELRGAFGQQAVSQADLADRPGRPPRSASRLSRRARSSTASSIGSVRTPVNVFCWLG